MIQEEDDDMEDIILNLKIISKIKQHEKLIVVNKTLVVDNRLIQPFWRWYTADNRMDTISFITNTIKTALECMSNTTNKVCDKDTIKQELLTTLIGLDNLSATYKLDNLTVAKIDLLHDKIVKHCNS